MLRVVYQCTPWGANSESQEAFPSIRAFSKLGGKGIFTIDTSVITIPHQLSPTVPPCTNAQASYLGTNLAHDTA